MANPGQPPSGQLPFPYGPPGAAVSSAGLPPARKGGGKALPLVLSAGLGAGVFAALMVFAGGKKAEAEAGATGSGSAAVAAADAGAAVATAADAGAAVAAAMDASAPVVTALDASVAPVDTAVTLTFEVSPPGAVVEVNGDKIASGIAKVALDDGTAAVKITATAAGYLPYTADRTVTKDETIRVAMTKQPVVATGNDRTGTGKTGTGKTGTGKTGTGKTGTGKTGTGKTGTGKTGKNTGLIDL